MRVRASKMCNQEFKYDERFKNIKKKELVKLLKHSHKREFDQRLLHNIEIAKQDCRFFELELGISRKDYEISKLKKTERSKTFWFKTSIFLGCLLCLVILCLFAKAT